MLYDQYLFIYTKTMSITWFGDRIVGSLLVQRKYDTHLTFSCASQEELDRVRGNSRNKFALLLNLTIKIEKENEALD